MLRENDYKFFNKAMCVASVSDYPKIHVGCIAVYHGHVVAIGCNSNKTHPMQKYYNQFREPDGEDISMTSMPKLHAEINCLNQLRHLNINFSKVKLYIYRIRNDKPYGMARPCPSCMAAIKDLGIRDIYYTTNDGFAYERIEKKEVSHVA